MDIQSLIRRHQLISDQVDHSELAIILRELTAALSRTQGAVVEFGCYVGTTSLFIQRVLNDNPRPFHVYDSFEGLPTKSSKDSNPAGEQFVSGALKASKSQFVETFKHANLTLPRIHKAWFSDLGPSDVPDQIGFAFLDSDYYESILASLQLIENRLEPGAIIVVDDYQSESLPGAKKAVDTWQTRHRYRCRVESSLAILTKA